MSLDIVMPLASSSVEAPVGESVTQPAVEPVDLAYAKTFLRVDGNAEDQLITDMLVSARERIEALTGHTLMKRRVTQRLKQSESNGTLREIFLTHQPFAELHRVRVRSISGHIETVPPYAYSVNSRAHPAKITARTHMQWHQFITSFECVEVDYSAGYGALPESVPMPFKQAILLLTAQSYEHRGDSAERHVPMMVEALLMPYRWMKL